MSKGLKVFAIIMVLAFVLSVAGCQKTPAANTTQPVTINVITMDQAAMSTAEMDAIAREFEAKNPGIKVNMEYVGYDYLHDKIVTGLSANPPAYDAVMVDVVWPDEFIKAGYLEDVTSRITTDMKDGMVIVRIILPQGGAKLVSALHENGYGVTAYDGEGANGPVKLIFTIVPRKALNDVKAIIHQYQPSAFISIEDIRSTEAGVFPSQSRFREDLLFRRKGK